MDFIAPTIFLKSPSALYFTAVTNIYTHATCAPFRPGHNWMFQQGDAPNKHISEQEPEVVTS